MHAYRVVSSFQPFPETIHVSGSHDIHFRNLHIYSDSKAVFDASVRDDDSNTTNHELEIAALNITASGSAKALPPAATAKRLAGGFFNAASPALDPKGRLYFIDQMKQHIYRYTPASGRLEIVRDNPIDPGNIFFDKAGHLMIVSYIGTGTVYTVDPDAPATELQALKAEPIAAHPEATPILAVDHWRFDSERQTDIGGRKPWAYMSPDGTTFLPAGDDFVGGALYYGTKMADVLRAFKLAPATPGKTFYVTDEGQKKTFSAHVAPDGSLTDVKLFTMQGGESVTAAPDGNVYIAAGEIYVYSPAGKLLGQIDVPERPTGLIFGGPGGRTLYITARTSLYSAPMWHGASVAQMAATPSK
jgi:sugar lactone lactonase YvrE